jgi:undecaprenyl-diphosphatase
MALPRPLARLDVAGLRLARSCGHGPVLDRAVATYSHLGQHGMLWLALGTAGALRDPARGSRWRRATATVAGAYLANQAIKLTVRRRRPHLPELPPLVRTPTQLSFPSAHATSSFAAARAFSSLVAPAPLYALASTLALSRLYLGVHYPSDVLAGAALGHALGRAGR